MSRGGTQRSMHGGRDFTSSGGLRCRYCGALFAPSDSKGLNLHIGALHERKTRRKTKPPPGMQIEIHGVRAPRVPDVGHRRLEDGGWACRDCGLVYSDDERSALDQHWRLKCGAREIAAAEKAKARELEAAERAKREAEEEAARASGAAGTKKKAPKRKRAGR